MFVRYDDANHKWNIAATDPRRFPSMFHWEPTDTLSGPRIVRMCSSTYLYQRQNPECCHVRAEYPHHLLSSIVDLTFSYKHTVPVLLRSEERRVGKESNMRE